MDVVDIAVSGYIPIQRDSNVLNLDQEQESVEEVGDPVNPSECPEETDVEDDDGCCGSEFDG